MLPSEACEMSPEDKDFQQEHKLAKELKQAQKSPPPLPVVLQPATPQTSFHSCASLVCCEKKF